MLGLQIGNEWLDLDPGTSMEMELENPFLQFQDEVVGGYSLPLNARNTPKNVRLTEYASLIQQRVPVDGVECKAYDTGLQHSTGRLKIERPTHNLNHAGNGNLSLYYLVGSSSFMQEARNKKLKEVNLGGDRKFNVDLGNYWNQSGSGFWAHVHTVMNAGIGAYDYAFFPVVNQDSGHGPVMNEVSLGRVLAIRDGDSRNPIVPFPYLHFVLRKAVEHCGWSISGDILDSDDFRKICIVNTRAVDYITNYWIHPTITFNLCDHVPNWTVPELLLNLRKRFGWWYDFDYKAKIIRVRALSEVVGASIKEMTAYADPVVVKKVAAQKTVYSLKNNFSGAYAGASVDFSKVEVKGEVFLKSELPEPGQAIYRHAYLVISENNWYVCRNNDAGTEWGWHILQYNCLDVVPAGATQEITTSCTTLGMEYYNSYLDLVPRLDASLTWGDEESSDSTMPLLFYHGLQVNKNGHLVPYASSHPYSSAGTELVSWSLAFECKLQNGAQVGLYHTNYKPLLDTFSGNEELEVKLYLKRVDFLSLKFSDIISIAGVRMYIRKMKYRLPYDGAVQLECVRI